MELGPSNGITKEEAVTWSVYLRTLNRSLRRSLLKSQWCDDPKKSFYKVLLQETIKFKDYPSFVWCYYKWVSENKTTYVYERRKLKGENKENILLDLAAIEMASEFIVDKWTQINH